MGGSGPVEWDRDRAADLAALMADAMPGERLDQDELLACCWDDPGVVLANPGGDGAVAAVVRDHGAGRIGYVKLLAVAPGARRAGLGAELLASAESWMRSQEATTVRLGGSAPFYLWPGVDVQATAMLCLAEAAGYVADGAELDLSCPTTFRSKPPEGVVVRRILDDGDVAAATAFAREDWSWWLPELERGIEQGGAFAAMRSDHDAPDHAGPPGDRRVLGFACHSVNRAAWIGPMATRPDQQGRGIGSALLSDLCRDLMIAGHADAEIAWVGPVSFYAKTARATVTRVFRTFTKRLV